MASTPTTRVEFISGRGRRVVEGLPQPLPEVGDDFDWAVRDFDSFRRFMLEELAARVPERTRWTPADLEVVLIEVLAAALDQLSDMADRVAAEAYLETARQPESVRRLLRFIGYDALQAAFARQEIAADPITDPVAAETELDQLWLRNPGLMDAARRAGPRELHALRRAVLPDDYAAVLRGHPLVRQACAWSEWSGSWTLIRIAVQGWNEKPLDAPNFGASVPQFLKRQVATLHRSQQVDFPAAWLDGSLDVSATTLRSVLAPYLGAFRMAGHEVLLEDAVQVGIELNLDIEVDPNYFQSEVRVALELVLGSKSDGFFAPGKLGFGQDLYVSDVIEVLTRVDGVVSVGLQKFRRSDRQEGDQTARGFLRLGRIELATCQNDPTRAQLGRFQLRLRGGRPG